MKRKERYFDTAAKRNYSRTWKTLLKSVNVNVNVKLSLCFLLTEHHAMKAYWGVEV
jgi:hypothetical protein